MPYVFAVKVGFILGLLVASYLIEAQEGTNVPVRCVVELNQAVGLNQQTIRYEGKVK